MKREETRTVSAWKLDWRWCVVRTTYPMYQCIIIIEGIFGWFALCACAWMRYTTPLPFGGRKKKQQQHTEKPFRYLSYALSNEIDAFASLRSENETYNNCQKNNFAILIHKLMLMRQLLISDSSENMWSTDQWSVIIDSHPYFLQTPNAIFNDLLDTTSEQECTLESVFSFANIFWSNGLQSKCDN